jgi:hypothetical protein
MSRQPLYVDQFKQLIWAFRPESSSDKAQMRAALALLAQNAQADDGTDLKLDYLSIAFFMGLAHNMMPGVKEGLPLDPFYIRQMEARLNSIHPTFYRPAFVEKTFNDFLEGAAVETNLGPTEELTLGLVTRVGLSALMLEDATLESDSQDFEREYADFLEMAAILLRRWQDNGQIPESWELPVPG